MEKVLQYAKEHREKFLEKLKEFLRIPTISSQEESSGDIQRGAEFLLDHLKTLGVSARLVETEKHPLVYGEKIQDENLPTLLIYGHYDVQPPEPLEEWDSPPFEPEIRQGRIYARGSTDDKGQLWISLSALESFVRAGEPLPVNLKFCLEGEEEIGSPNLLPFVRENQELLKCHAVVISDTPLLGENLPTITCGLRGLVYMEVELRSVNQDLHSGSFGGAVDNPCHGLARMIASLHDDQGRVTIPGFYEDVLDLSEEDRQEMASLPFDEGQYARSLGAKKLWGEEGYSVLERTSARPTLDVNGIWGGYIQKGAKTIIPAKASAKISMRLVANQNPQKIATLVRDHLQSLCPSTMSIEITDIETAVLPYLADASHPLFQKAEKALCQAFGSEKVFHYRQGGSIPFVPVVAKTLDVPCLLLGFGLPGEQAHSPNEWFDLQNFYRGIDTMIYFFSALRGPQ